MSNFTFLTTNWPDLHATAIEAEQNVNSAPRQLTRKGQTRKGQTRKGQTRKGVDT